MGQTRLLIQLFQLILRRRHVIELEIYHEFDGRRSHIDSNVELNAGEVFNVKTPAKLDIV